MHAVLAAGLARQAAVERARAVAARANVGIEAQRALAFPGEDLHHAADRVGAIDGRTRTVDDLDMVDLRQRQRRPGGAADAGGRDAHAVDQHHVLRIRRAAQE